MIIQQRYSLTLLLFLFALTDFSALYASPRTFPLKKLYRKITPRLPMRSITESACDLLLDNDTTCIRGIAHEPIFSTIFLAINNQIFTGNSGTGQPNQPAALTFNDGVCGMDTQVTPPERIRLYSGSNVTLSVHDFDFPGVNPVLVNSINVGGIITDVSTVFVTEPGPFIVDIYSVYGNTVELVRQNEFNTLTSISSTTVGSAPICNIEVDYLFNADEVTQIVWLLQNGIVQAYTVDNISPLTLTPFGPPLSVLNQTICGLSVFKTGSSFQICSVFTSYNSTIQSYTFDKLAGIYVGPGTDPIANTACVIESTALSDILVGQCDSFVNLSL